MVLTIRWSCKCFLFCNEGSLHFIRGEVFDAFMFLLCRGLEPLHTYRLGQPNKQQKLPEYSGGVPSDRIKCAEGAKLGSTQLIYRTGNMDCLFVII